MQNPIIIYYYKFSVFRSYTDLELNHPIIKRAAWPNKAIKLHYCAFVSLPSANSSGF